MKWVRRVVWFALAGLAALVAIANRHPARVNLDPFASPEEGLGLTMPLYLLMFAFLVAGAALASIAGLARAWRWRRALRRSARAQAQG